MEKHLKAIDEAKLQKILAIKEAYAANELSLTKARQEIKNLTKTLKAYEIAYIEQKFQEFSADECQKEDIQKILEVFQDVMDNSRPQLAGDHPLAHYYQENDELEKIMLEIEDLVQYPVIKNQWLEIYDKLKEYRIHQARKQNQLYAVLERKGFDRPTTTMWTLDDFIWEEIKQGRQLLMTGTEAEFIAFQSTLVADIRDLITKENTILYPTALELIKPEEFTEMKSGDQEIGFAWITVEKAEAEVEASSGMTDFQTELTALLTKYTNQISDDQKLKVATGELTLKQINLIYQHLPVDISYVDENELVCFYTDTKHRIFPRSKNVIGRKVENCHPQKSVHIVKEIVEKFRSGQEDSVDFWINKPGLFIYIYYAAVRDEQGNFKGVLEMMQDCTHIREVEGSQTLLNWGSKKQTAAPVTEEVTLNDKPETIGATTSLKTLLESYPGIKEEIIKIHPNFKALNGPLSRIMIAKATVADMAERTGIDQDILIAKLQAIIPELEKRG